MSKIPGVKSAYAGSCPQSDIEIKEGNVDIIYASPETLVGDPEWRASIQNLPVSVLVIDEFHTIATWYV
uniref:Helicase ATP-binding domain-containing protein n=1 Tax=Magallana gigas TaxID=29159 RepID=A0A8W8JQT8_MAGGI